MDKNVKREKALLKKYGLKTCTRCREIKEVVQFPKLNEKEHHCYCKDCFNSYQRENYCDVKAKHRYKLKVLGL